MTKKFARNFFKTVDIFAKPKIILTAKFCPQNMVSLYCIDSINKCPTPPVLALPYYRFVKNIFMTRLLTVHHM